MAMMLLRGGQCHHVVTSVVVSLKKSDLLLSDPLPYKRTTHHRVYVCQQRHLILGCGLL